MPDGGEMKKWEEITRKEFCEFFRQGLSVKDITVSTTQGENKILISLGGGDKVMILADGDYCGAHWFTFSVLKGGK